MGHLILSRKKDEKVIIGDRMVTVQVVEIRGDKVRLGFEADDNLTVHREEVFEAIQKEKGGAEC